MKTRVFPAKTPEELDEKIRESVSNGYTPTIACVFCSVAQPVEQFQLELEMENRAYLEKQISRIGKEVAKMSHQKPWAER